MNTPMKRYSSGMFVRLTFSVAVHCEPEILLSTSPRRSAMLTAEKQERMREFQRRNVTVVFVSHNLTMIDNFCSRVSWMQPVGRLR
jgi:ABC-type polysaccharide/polyol phosphate transport system ATPase subunit